MLGFGHGQQQTLHRPERDQIHHPGGNHPDSVVAGGTRAVGPIDTATEALRTAVRGVSDRHCCNALSFARWCILVRCQGIALSMLEAFRLGAICFLLSFVSVGSVGGDLFKAIFLARRRPGKRVEAVASVLVDRASGLYGLLFLVVTGTLLLQPVEVRESAEGLEDLKFAATTLFGIGTAALLVLVFGGRSVDRALQWGSNARWVGPIIGKIAAPLRSFHRHPFAFGASLLMSVGVQGLFAISVYLLARSLYVAPPNLTEHLVIVPLGMLASALPLTPAGVGVWEVAIATLYEMIPATPTLASGTLVALTFEMLRILLALVATVFYWTANEEVRESLEKAEQQGRTVQEEETVQEEIEDMPLADETAQDEATQSSSGGPASDEPVENLDDKHQALDDKRIDSR